MQVLKSLLILAPTKCIIEVEAFKSKSKQRFDTDFAHTVKSRASESELISLAAAYR